MACALIPTLSRLKPKILKLASRRPSGMAAGIMVLFMAVFLMTTAVFIPAHAKAEARVCKIPQ